MAFLNDDELGAYRIEQMVFHLIGPDASHFVPLQAIDPGDLHDFFFGRVRAANAGVPYTFSSASAVRTRLQRIIDDQKTFQAESEGLAEDFQSTHGGAAARGAFLILVLKAGDARLFALLKADDENVVSYQVKDDKSGKHHVNLQALQRTFSENRETLQKSALIRLDTDGGELVVLDRQNQQKVARYFEVFLGARRLHDDANLTATLVKITRKVILENEGLVTPEVRRTVARRTYDAVAAGGSLDTDNQKAFLDTVVGQTLPADHELVRKFKNALRKARIEGVPVALDKAKLKEPNVRHYKTKSGIRVTAPIEFKELVEVLADRIIIYDQPSESYDDADGLR